MLKKSTLYILLFNTVYSKSERLAILDVFTNKTLASMDRANAKLKAKLAALNDSADKHAWGEE